MTTCDECGVRVSTIGYLGGGIICHECTQAKYVDDDPETLAERKERYGGG